MTSKLFQRKPPQMNNLTITRSPRGNNVTEIIDNDAEEEDDENQPIVTKFNKVKKIQTLS